MVMMREEEGEEEEDDDVAAADDDNANGILMHLSPPLLFPQRCRVWSRRARPMWWSWRRWATSSPRPGKTSSP
jgi:hypothetical protein